MAVTDVTLSNSQTIQVKRLGLFQLDVDIPKPEQPGHYTVTILYSNGSIEEQPFDISIPRDKPEPPFEDCEENTQDWYMWREYHRWQSGIAHYYKQLDALSDYFAKVEAYILANCISADDVEMIETWADWDMVYHAASPDLPTMEEIEAMADHVYQAKWREAKAFMAYQELDGSDGSYAWIPKQIADLMVRLGDTTDEFLGRSKHEITLLMAGQLIGPVMSALQNDKQYRDMKASHNAPNS